MYKTFTTLLLLVLLSSSFLKGQVVYTEPAFPTVDDEVTIFFDATQGTGGLAGCDCTVYIHTGVITNESSSPTDWKHVAMTWGVANPDWELTAVDGVSDLYTFTISPSIREYYNISDNEEVLELAFVFRNADGSLEGKAEGGVDIYYPVYPEDLPFTTLLLGPEGNSLVRNIGETINIRAVASQEATFQVLDNEVEVIQTTGTSLDYPLEVTEQGTHLVEVFISNPLETQAYSFSYVVPIDIAPENPPLGIEHGINMLGDTGVILSLFAPDKENAFVVGDFTDWVLNTDYQMTKSLDGNTFWLQVFDLVPGQNYTFQYLVDNKKVADPFSELVLDPLNDAFIPEETYPNLPEYPHGRTTGYVTLIQPGAPEYEWQTTNYERPPQEKLTIYELLVRDFIHRHDYTTLIDTLDYLERLGINAIELMPVCEFDGNISWGYNPVFHGALDKYYGSPDEFKRFVDECHSRGMAVIIDVVYNHASEKSPIVALYAGEPDVENNPYFNLVPKHPFNVFIDLNHESEATKNYTKKTLRYWQEEFRVDGFRFDLSKGLTQVDYGNDVGAWGSYDASRIAILKDYADAVWAVDEEAYVILEHFANNQEETELIQYGKGMMTWGNMNHNYNEASMGYSGNSLQGVSSQSRSWTEQRLIGYMESHDEERLMYKNLEFGNNTNWEHNVKNLQVALKRQELVSAFFYTIPGPKMLWQFGEVGYDVNIDFNGRTGPKPIRWEYYDDSDRRRLYNVTRSLIHLRNTYDVFHADVTNYALFVGAGTYGKTKRIELNGDDMDVIVIGNFDVFANEIDPNFQQTGTWYEYFSGETLEVSDANAPIELTPGEYRIYTSVQLPEPPVGYISTVGFEEIVDKEFQLIAWPNPTTNSIRFGYQLEQAERVQLELFNMLGQKIQTLVDEKQNGGWKSVLLENQLKKGSYLVKLRVGNKIETEVVVIH